MKVCIAYDTRRGSTTVIVNWMKEALKSKKTFNIDVKRAYEIDTLDYDMFIVGSPIYWEKPLGSVVNFLATNEETLKNKMVAVFIVCMAQVFGGLTTHYIKRHYLKPLEEHTPSLFIESGIFRGWLKKPNLNERKNIINWIERLIVQSQKILY